MQFELAVQQSSVYLTRDEVQTIIKHFSAKKMVEYLKISENLMGIKQGSYQQTAFDQMRRTHSNLNKIKSNLLQSNYGSMNKS